MFARQIPDGSILPMAMLVLTTLGVLTFPSSMFAGDTDQEQQLELHTKLSAFMPEVKLCRDSLRQMGILKTRASLARYVSSGGEYVPTLDEQAEFSRLATELGDEDYYVRENATAKLKANGNKFVAQLEELSKSTNDLEVRVRVEQLLREVNRHCTPVDALYVIARDHITGLEREILNRLDRDPSEACCRAAECALVATAQGDGCRLMQQHVNSTAPHHSKLVCLRVLACRSAASSRTTFQTLLRDPSPEIRLAAGIGLARLGDAAALDVLVDHLESDRLKNRHQAAYVLQRWQKQFFGFRAFADSESRRRTTKKWQDYVSNRNYVELQYRPPQRIGHVLAVRNNTLFEFDSDGDVVYRQSDFESLSEATAIENGNVLVTDWAGQSVYEFNRNWDELHKTSFSFQPRSAVCFPDGNMVVSTRNKVYFLDQNREPTRVAFFRSITASPLQLHGKRLLIWSKDDGGFMEIHWDGQIGEKFSFTTVPRSIDLLDDGRFLIADSRQVAIYEPNNPNPVWSHSHGGIRSASALASGNILLGHETGLTIIDRNKQIVWEWVQPQIPGNGFCATIF